MKTMEEIDLWYEDQINNAKLQGTIKVALKMLLEDMPLEKITRITELTIEQLQQLQASQNNS
jgi:predicted transposase YdaD